MKKLLFTFIALFCVMFTFAEFRIWENEAGAIWEAEFVAMNGQMVVLRDPVGKEQGYALADLGAADLDYLDEKLPPKLSIDISKTTNDGSSSTKTKVICNANIKQADTRTYEGNLTVVLLVLGEDVKTGAVSVASRTEENFTLAEPFEFSSKSATLLKGSAKRGRIYSGYLAVVWDRFGNPIAIETNKAGLEERATKMAYVSLKNRKYLDL